MALLTVDQIREHIDTGLDDAALERVIDAEDQEIEYYAGEIAEQVDRFVQTGEVKVLYLTRKASSISSVVVEDYPESNRGGVPTETTLSANDYQLVGNDRRVDRLPTGDNPESYWEDVVMITYVPFDDTKRRKSVLIDLVKLNLAYSGNLRESLPDYTVQNFEDHQVERERILTRVRGRWFA